MFIYVVPAARQAELLIAFAATEPSSTFATTASSAAAQTVAPTAAARVASMFVMPVVAPSLLPSSNV